MKSGEDYKTDITLSELKAHYEYHRMSGDHFISLIETWHKEEMKVLTNENINLKIEIANLKYQEELKKDIYNFMNDIYKAELTPEVLNEVKERLING